jgi:hypothetical protein
LKTHRKKETDFTRTRHLNLEHTVGMVLHMASSRNENGYDITSQNYFEELGNHLKSPIEPPTRQSVSEARAKLKWEGFESLLCAANQEKEFDGDSFRFKGHITRAVDGTSMIVPRTADLLGHFTPRISKAGECHYPSLLAVIATNVFSGQPVAATINDHTASERDGLLSMIRNVFGAGDLSLLDRGYPAGWLFWEFEKAKQYYLARVKTTGDYLAAYIRKFLKSGKKDKVITLTVEEIESKKEVKIKVRLVRGPKDSEGKTIAFATNLIGKKYKRKSILKLYRERWEAETLYGRVKNLLKVERFHARSYNGVMQEIFANLLVLSLTSLVCSATRDHHRLKRKKQVPSFKNATEVLRRHFFDAVDKEITGTEAEEIATELVAQTARVLWKKQPGRSFPRVSKQPIKVWNLAKTKKIAEFQKKQGSKSLT